MLCRESRGQLNSSRHPIVGLSAQNYAKPRVTRAQERTSRGTTVLWLDEPFRAPAQGELRHRVLELLRRGERHIVLNMVCVSRIDAAGAGELVRAYNVTVAAKGVLQIVHATPWVRDVLTRAGLFQLLSGGGGSDATA